MKMIHHNSSRFIVGHDVFDASTSHNAVEILKVAITKHGKPASILSDHGTQFHAVSSQERKRGVRV